MFNGWYDIRISVFFFSNNISLTIIYTSSFQNRINIFLIKCPPTSNISNDLFALQWKKNLFNTWPYIARFDHISFHITSSFLELSMSTNDFFLLIKLLLFYVRWYYMKNNLWWIKSYGVWYINLLNLRLLSFFFFMN